MGLNLTTVTGPCALLYEVIEWLALLPDALLHRLARAADGPGVDWDALGRYAPDDISRQDYAAWAAQQAQRAHTQLATGYLRYALRLARNAVGSGLDFPDLAQHGFPHKGHGVHRCPPATRCACDHLFGSPPVS